jgi:hypothetical protein
MQQVAPIEQIPVVDPTEAELLTYEPVSQEGYDIQPLAAAGGKPGIITWGIYPCIIIAFHNPDHGIYFAHTLKFNFFFKDSVSTACVAGREGPDECIPGNATHPRSTNKLKVPIDCGSTSIADSFPAWIHDEKTVCYLYAHSQDGESETLPIRLAELQRVYKGPIRPYISDNYDKIIFKQDGSFFATSLGYGDLPDELKARGKTKDMALFRSQLGYYFQKQKSAGVPLASLIPQSTVNLTKFVDEDYSFKPAASVLSNFYELQKLTVDYGVRGLIFRECIVQQGGGRRLPRLRLRLQTRRRTLRRQGRSLRSRRRERRRN